MQIFRRIKCFLPLAPKTFVRSHNAESFTKTQAIFLNEMDTAPLMVNSYSRSGFSLNNSFSIIGSLVIFPKSVLSWNVRSSDQINEDSMSLFYMLEPKVDVLIIGVGDKGCKINQNTMSFMKSKGFSLEILPTDQACSTYNFLAMEGRFVGAALIPPQNISIPNLGEVPIDKKKLTIDESY